MAVQTFVERLRSRMRVTAVLLFGSRARGDWLKESDVDLLVLSPDLQGVPHLTRLERLFAEWAAVSRLSADVLGLTPDEFAARSDEFSVIGRIAREGVVVFQEPGWVRPPSRRRAEPSAATRSSVGVR